MSPNPTLGPVACALLAPAIDAAQIAQATPRLINYARMCARSDLESFCRWNELDGHTWCDTSAIHPEDRAAFIGDALWVLGTAGQLITHPEYEHLVRISPEADLA